MRYGIFSDIHANLEAFNAVLQAYQKEKIDQYLCIGDVVGYAANPKECIEKVKTLAIITVAGNHDWASVDLFSLDYFNPVAKAAIIWTQRNLDDQERYFLQSLKLVYKNKDLTLVHGTLDEPQDFHYLTDTYLAAQTFDLAKNQVCFIGHSHVAGIYIQDQEKSINYLETDLIEIKGQNKYIINVGSVGQPRDDNPEAAYCIYDTEKEEIKIKRISYDIETARSKIIKAGLPRILGDRLLLGR